MAKDCPTCDQLETDLQDGGGTYAEHWMDENTKHWVGRTPIAGATEQDEED